MSRLMTKPTKWQCAQRRLRSAWASAQSDQSLRCPHEESLGPWLPIELTAKTDQTLRMPRLIRVFAGDSDQTGQMRMLIWVFAGRTCYFAGFVIRRLKCKSVIDKTNFSGEVSFSCWSESSLDALSFCWFCHRRLVPRIVLPWKS